MAIRYDKLISLGFPEVEQTYTVRDTILYALGLGLGADPLDEKQLQFVYENGLKALPTMAGVLAYPGFWLRELDTGIDWVRAVHGEQKLTLHRAIPVSGTVVGQMRITEVIDKGAGKGALVHNRREIYAKATGDHLATIDGVVFCRADGGFGGPQRPSAPPRTLPDRDPDIVVTLSTIPQQALIYRLNGDVNPLHADPAIAAAAGYPKPILHGLATYGIAGYALLRAVCGYDPGRLVGMEARFSAPVLPGDAIRTEIWKDGAVAAFRALVPERNVVVLQNGFVQLRD